jgi:molybdenum cofactor cytidylyltransferase
MSTPRFFAIVPAAGRSARMGQPKLLLPWGNATLVEQVLGQWRASGVSDVIVVVHPDDSELAELCRGAGAQVVVPDVPPPDMKSSVGHALAWIGALRVPTSDDAWLLAPADMPRLNAALIDFVIANHQVAAPRIIVPTAAGRRGHPVLFPWSLAADVATLGENEGLNALLARSVVSEVAWGDASAFADVDDPADYERLRPERPL